jgi:uncharacterized protein involved in response to NO
MAPSLIVNWYRKFSSQPHQPFFVLGAISLIVFTSIIVLHFTIVDFTTTMTRLHIYPLIFIVFGTFFLGFLFVVFPKFLMQSEIKQYRYMSIFWLLFTAFIVYTTGIFISDTLIIIGNILIFVAQLFAFITLYKIDKKSTSPNKYDTNWVLISFLAGISSNFLFLLSEIQYFSFFANIATYVGFYLFIFLMILTISQKMIPMFTSIKVPSYVKMKSKYIMEIVFIFLIIKVYGLSANSSILNLIADFSLFIFFVYEFIIKWKLPILTTNAIIWILHISLLWIPIGFFVSAVESLNNILHFTTIVFEKSTIHIFAIGYFLSIFIGFASRVILGHSGKAIQADRVTVFIFIAIQMVLLCRVFAGLTLNFKLDYIYWVNFSAIFLISILLLWSKKYILILLKGN